MILSVPTFSQMLRSMLIGKLGSEGGLRTVTKQVDTPLLPGYQAAAIQPVIVVVFILVVVVVVARVDTVAEKSRQAVWV